MEWPFIKASSNALTGASLSVDRHSTNVRIPHVLARFGLSFFLPLSVVLGPLSTDSLVQRCQQCLGYPRHRLCCYHALKNPRNPIILLGSIATLLFMSNNTPLPIAIAPSNRHGNSITRCSSFQPPMIWPTSYILFEWSNSADEMALNAPKTSVASDRGLMVRTRARVAGSRSR